MPRQLLADDEIFPVPETDLPGIAGASDEVTYYLRPISAAKLDTLTKANTKRLRGQEIVNSGAWLRQAVDYCLDHWDGVNANGNPAPCDSAHKAMLPSPIQNALVERAQMGAMDEAAIRAESFRES